jgi:hypothetical protein
MKLRVEQCRWYYGGPPAPGWVVTGLPLIHMRIFDTWREAVDYAFSRDVWHPL